MKCGMCQAVCPIYAETGRESDVARGKIALLEGLAHEMIKNAQEVQDRLNRCLLCGSCAANCPSGVKVLDIFIKARAILTGYMGLSPVKQAIFKGLLQHPKLFNNLLGVASKFQGVFTKPVNDMIGSSCARFTIPILGDRHIIPLAKEALHTIEQDIDTRAGASGLKVALFPGCVTDKIYPRIGQAVLKVMAHHGVGVYMPRVQSCCGIPTLSSGDRETFDKLVADNMEIFGEASGAQFDYLITPCATCTSTIKKLWPSMAEGLPGNIRRQIRDLAAKTLDVNQFLVDKLGLTPPAQAAGATPVTVHDPCHLKKSLGVAAQPRTVIRMNPAYAVTEMLGSDNCCGSGGSFTLQHYELSKKVGGKKRDSILATGAPIVAAGCPACMMQISDMLSQQGAKVAVKHPIELYAEALR
jgi:glycolate oxidase iron-sulfur subunit